MQTIASLYDFRDHQPELRATTLRHRLPRNFSGLPAAEIPLNVANEGSAMGVSHKDLEVGEVEPEIPLLQ